MMIIMQAVQMMMMIIMMMMMMMLTMGCTMHIKCMCNDYQEKDGSEAGLAVQMALNEIREMAEQGTETAEGIEVDNF